MRRDNSLLVLGFIAAASTMVPRAARTDFTNMPKRSNAGRASGGSGGSHQGQREIERRRRQIARGQLREQNGLDRA